MDEMEIIRHGKVEGLSLFLDTVDYRTAHFHNDWEIIWVLNGRMQLVLEQSEYTLEENSIYILASQMTHEMHKIGTSCTFLCLQLSKERFPEIGNVTLDDPNTSRYLNEMDQLILRRWLADASYAYFRQDKYYEMECLGIASRVFYKCLSAMPARKITWDEVQNRTNRNARLFRLEQFVDEGYMHKINLSDFAKEEGCSLSYLSHFIKDSLNQTFQEYVNTVRYNCACKLIASGKNNLLDICMESGFSDYRYFVKTFRKMCGMTPEEFRKSQREEIPDNAVRHSIHSLEKFYTLSQSIELMDRWIRKLVPNYF